MATRDDLSGYKCAGGRLRADDTYTDLQCPNCKAWINFAAWEHDDNYCETCGDHECMVCPACDDNVDYVHDEFSGRC